MEMKIFIKTEEVQMKRKRIIAALLTGTMLCSSIMEPRAMDLSDWSINLSGREMQWKETGTLMAKKSP